MWYGVLVWSVQSSCPRCAPWKHPPPGYSQGWETGGWEGADQGRTKTREALDAVPALLSNSKSTAVLLRLSWSQMPNTAPQQLLWRILTPPQLEPAKSHICCSTHLLHSGSELLSPSSCHQCVNSSMHRQQELIFHTDKFVGKKGGRKTINTVPETMQLRDPWDTTLEHLQHLFWWSCDSRDTLSPPFLII